MCQLTPVYPFHVRVGNTRKRPGHKTTLEAPPSFHIIQTHMSRTTFLPSTVIFRRYSSSLLTSTTLYKGQITHYTSWAIRRNATYLTKWSLSDSICLRFCFRAGVAWSETVLAVRLENQDILPALCAVICEPQPAESRINWAVLEYQRSSYINSKARFGRLLFNISSRTFEYVYLEGSTTFTT